MPLKRWASVLFVTCYLLSLSWGIVAHTLKVGISGNTLSYLCRVGHVLRLAGLRQPNTHRR